jgi:hypothetical protein
MLHNSIKSSHWEDLQKAFKTRSHWGPCPSITQLKAVQAMCTRRPVLDLGCGHGAWLNVLTRLGASSAVGVDRLPLEIPVSAPNTKFLEKSTFEWESPFTRSKGSKWPVLFLSYPLNRPWGEMAFVHAAPYVVYYGTNLDGTACGSSALWQYLTTRECIYHRRDRGHTLAIYTQKPRQLYLDRDDWTTADEMGALNHVYVHTSRSIDQEEAAGCPSFQPNFPSDERSFSGGIPFDLP